MEDYRYFERFLFFLLDGERNRKIYRACKWIIGALLLRFYKPRKNFTNQSVSMMLLRDIALLLSVVALLLLFLSNDVTIEKIKLAEYLVSFYYSVALVCLVMKI